MPESKRLLKIFISYASQDKTVVQELSKRLASEGWIDPWVDEKKLLPGQDWRAKIEEAVESSDSVIICLSSNSVSKEGFVQKELRYAREIALEKPEETIFIIPLRLDECDVPRGLRFYQWADYFAEKKDETYGALVESLKLRYEQKLIHEEKERARHEKEKQEREVTEKITREITDKITREKIEQETTERIVRENANREAAEKAKREKLETQSAQKVAIAQSVTKSFVALKSVLTQNKPLFRVTGITGMVIVLFWIGSLVLPELPSFISTVEPSATIIPTSIPTLTSLPTRTLTLTSLPTSTLTLTPLPTNTPDPKILTLKATSDLLKLLDTWNGKYVVIVGKNTEIKTLEDLNGRPVLWDRLYDVGISGKDADAFTAATGVMPLIAFGNDIPQFLQLMSGNQNIVAFVSKANADSNSLQSNPNLKIIVFE